MPGLLRCSKDLINTRPTNDESDNDSDTADSSDDFGYSEDLEEQI